MTEGSTESILGVRGGGRGVSGNGTNQTWRMERGPRLEKRSRPLVWEESTCSGATKHMLHNY